MASTVSSEPSSGVFFQPKKEKTQKQFLNFLMAKKPCKVFYLLTKYSKYSALIITKHLRVKEIVIAGVSILITKSLVQC
jgi:hypothetical protein